MYAYIDETGNSGVNLFDNQQKIYYSAALITKNDFNHKYGKKISALSKYLKVRELHANELGVAKIEHIANDILHIINKCQGVVAFAQVNKRDLALTKLADIIFDSGENYGVPSHLYLIKPLRLLLVCKLSYLVDDIILKKFFSSCLMEQSITKAYTQFKNILCTINKNVHLLPDARSREIFNNAFEWAYDNIENITIHSRGKIDRQGHSPTFIAFTELLTFLELKSQKWNQQVKHIIHDEQKEFKECIIDWHKRVANDNMPENFFLPDGGITLARKACGSNLMFAPSNVNAGIQIIDILLWVYKRHFEGNTLGYNCRALLFEVLKNAYNYTLSLESIEHGVATHLAIINEFDLTEEQIAQATEFVRTSQRVADGHAADYKARKKITTG